MKFLLTLLLSSLALDMVPFKDYSYAIVDQKPPYTVTVDCGSVPSDVDVSPHSKGIQPSIEGSKVSFTISEYGQYQLLADGKRYFVFADAPAAKVQGKSILSFKRIERSGVSDITSVVQKAINETATKGEILVFPEGTYLCKQLTLPSGAHLHLEKGAVLKANPSSWENFSPKDDVKSKRFINIKDAKNVKVTGCGAINGSGRELREQFGNDARIRLVMAIASSDILFEGVLLQDPGSWNTQILRCENVTYRNVKLMNDFNISNTDGFDPDASKKVIFENSFAMCSDDNVAIKTTGYSGYSGELHNVIIRGNVFITKKSALKIGTETKGKRMEGILFENNDVLEFDRGMAIYVSDGAFVNNVKYSNNRFERYATNISYDNGRTDKYKVNGKVTGLDFSVKGRKDGSKIGYIDNLVIENCSFETSFLKESHISTVPEGFIKAKISNLMIGGVKVASVEDANIKVDGAEIVFE